METEKFLEIIKQELVESNVTLDGNFRDLEEWDSLTAMSLIVVLEDNYGVKLPDDVFKGFNTFRDIFNYLNK